MKEWELARKEQEGKLARREEKLVSLEKKAKAREDELASREGTVEDLEKREAEVSRLVGVVAQEREALEVRAKELTAAEQSHLGAVESFRRRNRAQAGRVQNLG